MSVIQSPAVRTLLSIAALYMRHDGVIPTDVMAGLDREGYDLDRLEGDVELILNNYPDHDNLELLEELDAEEPDWLDGPEAA